MEKGMLRIMSSLVYDWLVSAGDDNLAKKFKEEVSPESLPPNSLRLADIVKIYQKENTPRKRKAGPLMSARDAKKARKEEVPASKGVPAHAVAKPAAQKKKSRLEKDDSIDEEEEAQLGVEIAPEVMLVAAKRRKSNSDDGKIGIPDAKVDEAISDDESSFEGEKAKPAVKQVQVVDLESSSESDDDSIVEEENPKPPGRSVQTVVLESSSDCSGDSSSDSSDDEEEMAPTERAASTKGATGIVSTDTDAAKKVDGAAAASGKVEKSPVCTGGETVQQETALGCRLFVHGVTQNIDIVDFQSAFEAHGKVLDVFNSKKGFAFVTFSKASEATAAIEAFDKQVVCGCSVNVSLAKPKGGKVTSNEGKQGGQGGGEGRGQEEVKGARLYVNNLSQEISRENLYEKFSLHGNVVDTFYKPGKGFAFVTFASAAEANDAIVAMNGKNMCGKAIQCSVAKPRENGGRGGGRRFAGGRGARKSGFV